LRDRRKNNGDGHVESEFRRVGLDVDEIAFYSSAAVKVDDSRDKRNFDTWEVSMNNRPIVELAGARQLERYQRAARIALTAGFPGVDKYRIATAAT